MRQASPVIKKREGMALALVLVTLLVGGALIAVSLVLVENMFYTSSEITERIQLYNAAQDGIERGKEWIFETTRTEEVLPRWVCPSDLTGTLQVGQVPGGDYSILLAMDLSGNSCNLSYSLGPANVTVEVYDMSYRPGSGLADEYVSGFPPSMRFDFDGLFSEHMASTYSTSNRGEGSSGSVKSVSVGVYLIRSKAEYGESEKWLEQVVIARL